MKKKIKGEILCEVQAPAEVAKTVLMDDGMGMYVIYSHLCGDIIGSPSYIPKDNFLMIIKQLNNVETK